ncbi:MAG: GNAT family N-acetyltransferase [Lewinellaceae bacterium]|nr:GNAT family N-acetyltransferase [Lewinellaceae bacterium]
MTLQFLPARPSDAVTLTAIAHHSKQHWGYPEEWMKIWAEELEIRPEFIEKEMVVKAEAEAEIIGFYALQPHTAYDATDLAHFWLLPEHIGKGYGRQMFEHMLQTMQKAGAETLLVESDPYASGFYEKMGGRKVGERQSSIAGRKLPVYAFAVGLRNLP